MAMKLLTVQIYSPIIDFEIVQSINDFELSEIDINIEKINYTRSANFYGKLVTEIGINGECLIVNAERKQLLATIDMVLAKHSNKFIFLNN